MIHSFRLSSFAGAALLALLASANVSADTPDPIPAATVITTVINPDDSLTVTASGRWQWTTRRNDCNVERFAAGWAVDWGDADQIGNYVGTINNEPIHVGVAVGNERNEADNQVHYYTDPAKPRCGVFAKHANGSYNTGDWGPISHTYKSVLDAINISICVVMYDVHNAKGKGRHQPGKPGPHGKPAEPKEGDLIAGGDNNNHDNSVVDNARTPLGNQCIRVPIPLDQIPV